MRHSVTSPVSALLTLCAGNSPVSGEIPSQRPVTRSFEVFFDLRRNERVSKQSWGWWFETPSRSLWHRSCITSKSISLRYIRKIITAIWKCSYGHDYFRRFGVRRTSYLWSFMGLSSRVRIRSCRYVLLCIWRTVSALGRVLFWWLYNKRYNNMIAVSRAHKQFATLTLFTTYRFLQSASISLCRHWPVGDLWPSRITISPWAEKVVH